MVTTFRPRALTRSANAPHRPLPNAPQSAIRLTAPAAIAGAIFTSVKYAAV